VKLNEAKDIISGKHARKGYVVTFETRVRGGLLSDHFPDVHAGEPGITSEEEAWDLAGRFARAEHKAEVVNVYVVHANNFMPVSGYDGRTLNRYPAR
jgi:hypothetical protein